MSELEKTKTEQQSFSANEIAEFLPKIEFETLAQKEERLDKLEIILAPLRDDVQIKIGRIDILKPYNHNLLEPENWKEYEQGIDPNDNSKVYDTPYGRMALRRVMYSNRNNIGYNFHLYVPTADFGLVENYLSYIYNTERSKSPLYDQDFKHVEKEITQNNTVVHSFMDSKLKYNVILHTENDLLELIPIIIEEPKQKTEPSIPDLQVEKFDIEKFPLTEKELRESQDPKDALKAFIKTAIALLRLNYYKLEYQEEAIFQNEQISNGLKVLESKPFKLCYSGIENTPGINLFFNLLKARLLYPFEIEYLEVIAHTDHVKGQLTTGLQLIHTDEQRRDPKLRNLYTTKSGIDIQLIKNDPINSLNKGLMTWNIIVPSKYSDEIEEILKMAEDVDSCFKDLYGFKIKSTWPGQYSHVIAARKAERV
jgi:hypothetical protein